MFVNRKSFKFQEKKNIITASIIGGAALLATGSVL
jgi:hypothetical protein